MSSWETPNTTAPTFDQTQAPAHIAHGSWVEYKTKSGRGDHHFLLSYKTRDHGADGIVTTVAGAFCLRDCELHEFFLRFVSWRNHSRIQRIFFLSLLELQKANKPACQTASQ